MISVLSGMKNFLALKGAPIIALRFSTSVTFASNDPSVTIKFSRVECYFQQLLSSQ